MHLKAIPFHQKKRKNERERFCLKFSWTPSPSVQQVSLSPKSMFPYSVGSSFSTPISGSTKWQTNISLSFHTLCMKKSCRDGRKFLLSNFLVKSLAYWKQIWRWKVAYACSFLCNEYYLYIKGTLMQIWKFPYMFVFI